VQTLGGLSLDFLNSFNVQRQTSNVGTTLLSYIPTLVKRKQ